jgi:hypothetical protein
VATWKKLQNKPLRAEADRKREPSPVYQPGTTKHTIKNI